MEALFCKSHRCENAQLKMPAGHRYLWGWQYTKGNLTPEIIQACCFPPLLDPQSCYLWLEIAQSIQKCVAVRHNSMPPKTWSYHVAETMIKSSVNLEYSSDLAFEAPVVEGSHFWIFLWEGKEADPCCRARALLEAFTLQTTLVGKELEEPLSNGQLLVENANSIPLNELEGLASPRASLLQSMIMNYGGQKLSHDYVKEQRTNRNIFAFPFSSSNCANDTCDARCRTDVLRENSPPVTGRKRNRIDCASVGMEKMSKQRLPALPTVEVHPRVNGDISSTSPTRIQARGVSTTIPLISVTENQRRPQKVRDDRPARLPMPISGLLARRGNTSEDGGHASSDSSISPRRSTEPRTGAPPRLGLHQLSLGLDGAVPKLPSLNRSATPQYQTVSDNNIRRGAAVQSPRPSSIPLTPSPAEERKLAAVDDEQLSRNSMLAKYRAVCSEVIPDRLYIGGDDVARNKSLLESKKITHILNTAGDTCANHFQDVFDYLTFVLEDTRMTNEGLEAVLFPCFDFIEEGTSNQNRVLVHCKEGVSRSSTVAVGYLMWKQKKSFKEALEYIRSCRGVCNPNTGFTFTLLKFGKRLQAAADASSLDRDEGSKVFHHASTGELAPALSSNRFVERKLFRVALHHPSAPVLVLLGCCTWEPLTCKWIPANGLKMDPRFVYLFRDNYTFYAWRGPDVPAGLHIIMKSTVEAFVKDTKKYEGFSHPIELHWLEPPDSEKFVRAMLSADLDGEGTTKEERNHFVLRDAKLDNEADWLSKSLPTTSLFEHRMWKMRLRKVRTPPKVPLTSDISSNEEQGPPPASSEAPLLKPAEEWKVGSKANEGSPRYAFVPPSLQDKVSAAASVAAGALSSFLLKSNSDTPPRNCTD